MNHGSNKIIERRKGPDLLVKWVKISAILAWIFFFPVIMITDKARPEMRSILHKLLKIRPRETWDYGLMEYTFYCLVFLFIFNMISILINALRNKRKSDRLSVSLIVSGLLSFIGIIIYLIYFYNG